MWKFFSNLYARFENYWHWLTEGERDLLRLVAALAVLGLLGAAAYRPGQRWWHRWQHDEALSQAQQFAAQRDYRSTLLALRRATELAPDDLTTWQEVARYLAEIGSPESVVVRQNLIRLAPADMSLRIALLMDALRFGQMDAAHEAVDTVDEASRREVAYHRLAAALALVLGQSDELEVHLAALVAAQPKDRPARFYLAAARLWNVDLAASAAARAELEDLTADPEVRVRAALELLKHAGWTQDPRRADQVVAFLLARFDPVAAHGLLPAGPDRIEPPGWLALLAALKQAAPDSPNDVALLSRWLGEIGLGQETLHWIESLPPALHSAAVVMDVAADLAAETGDLRRLESLLCAGAWGRLPDDVVTLALAARVQKLRYNDNRATATWNDAVAAGAESLGALRALSRLAFAWRQPADGEQALEAIVARFAKVRWAFDALRVSYATRRELAKLWRLYDTWAPRAPDDMAIQREWIRLGCVLGTANEALHARARELYASDPHETTRAVSYAASLWRQGRSREALPVLMLLPRAALEQPANAFWLGLVLSSSGKKELARNALARAFRPDLSPEELTLLREACARVGYMPPTGP